MLVYVGQFADPSVPVKLKNILLLFLLLGDFLHFGARVCQRLFLLGSPAQPALNAHDTEVRGVLIQLVFYIIGRESIVLAGVILIDLLEHFFFLVFNLFLF